jgi:hypothetical protein
MRISTIVAVCLLTLGGGIACGQNNPGSLANTGGAVVAPPPSSSSYSGWGNYGNPAGGTVAGSYLYGLGDVVRAEGEYNLNTSAAAINYTTAQRQQIQNWQNYIDAYYYSRRVYQDQVAAKTAKDRKFYQEDWPRIHASMQPQRLPPTALDPVTGKLQWPVVLRTPTFENRCAELQELFAKRAHYGALSYEDNKKVTGIANAMIADLQDNIREYSANNYLEAKGFLQKLSYESSLPTT